MGFVWIIALKLSMGKYSYFNMIYRNRLIVIFYSIIWDVYCSRSIFKFPDAPSLRSGRLKNNMKIRIYGTSHGVSFSNKDKFKI